MDHDIAQKKKLRKSSSPPRSTQSKFFHTPSESKASGVQRRHSDGVIAAGSSKLKDKENLYIVVDDDDEATEISETDLDGSDLSLKAQYDHDAEMDLHVDEFPDVVEQEDGYISPTPSCSKDVQDLSSPLRPGQSPARRKWKSDRLQQVENSAIIQSDEDAYFGVEAVSSPVSVVKRRVSPFVGRGSIPERSTKRNGNDDGGDDCILVHSTPSPTKAHPVDEVPSPILYYGPDLREALAIASDGATDLNHDELSDYGLDEDIEQVQLNATKVVMSGWRDRWALTSKTKKVPTEEEKTKSTPCGGVPRCIPGSGSSRIANLKRSNTNVTPRGRHALSSVKRYPPSAPSKMAAGSGMNAKARRSILFIDQTTTNPSAHGKDGRCRKMVDMSMTDDATEMNGVGMVSGLDDIALRAHERLSMFRYGEESFFTLETVGLIFAFVDADEFVIYKGERESGVT